MFEELNVNTSQIQADVESVGKTSVSLEGVHRDKSVLFFLIIIFLAVLCCCPDFSLVAEWRLLSSCGARRLIVVASLSEVQALGSRASVLVVLELICTVECGIFPVQGANQCPLHCKADSYPLDHSSVQFSCSVVSNSL